MSIKPADLARVRLAAQGIIPVAGRTPVETVRWMTAMQGQDFPGALWSIGLRSPGSTRSEVEAAFNSGELVRSWPMRGTLHVTAADDLGWILSLTGERTISAVAARHRQLEITAADLDAVRDAARGLLAGPSTVGYPANECPRATRDQLFQAFESIGQRTNTQRGIHFLWLLCIEGTLVQGPINANAQFFVRTDQWITAPKKLGREEAVAELTLRYFRSHGPATIKDFQWWCKLMLVDIKAGLDAVRDQLETIECDGQTYYLAPENARLFSGNLPGGRSLYLLPGFDEYLLGYADRSASLAPHHAPLTVPGNNGMFKSTIVGTGKVLGTWRKAQTAAEKQRQLADVVLPEPFEPLTPGQESGMKKAAHHYAAFLKN